MDNLFCEFDSRLSEDNAVQGNSVTDAWKLPQKADAFMAMCEMVKALVASINLDRTMEIIISTIGKLIPYQSCVLFLMEKESLLPAKSVTPYKELLSLSPLLHLEEPFINLVVRNRKPFLIPAMKSVKEKPMLKDEHCFMCVPLTVKEKIIGVVYVGTTTEGTYNEEHLNTLSILADMAAPSIEAAQLREEKESSLLTMQKLNENLKTLVRQYMALHEIGESLIIGLNVDEKLYPLGEIMMRIIDYQSLIIFLIDRKSQDGEIVPRYCRSPYDRLFNDSSFKKSDILRWVIDQKKPLLLEDTKESRLPNVVENERSAIIIPMMVEHEVIGVFYVGAAEPFRFDEEGLKLISTIAYQTTMALRNAMRYE